MRFLPSRFSPTSLRCEVLTIEQGSTNTCGRHSHPDAIVTALPLSIQQVQGEQVEGKFSMCPTMRHNPPSREWCGFYINQLAVIAVSLVPRFRSVIVHVWMMSRRINFSSSEQSMWILYGVNSAPQVPHSIQFYARFLVKLGSKREMLFIAKPLQKSS
jgi:hypothetical protein